MGSTAAVRPKDAVSSCCGPIAIRIVRISIFRSRGIAYYIRLIINDF